MSARLLGWAWDQPVSPQAKLALLALADGGENVAAVARRTGLTTTQAIDAVTELSLHMLVLWRHRRPYFRLGEAGFVDQDHRPIDEG